LAKVFIGLFAMRYCGQIMSWVVRLDNDEPLVINSIFGMERIIIFFFVLTKSTTKKPLQK
jgi:hypothetical protein